MAEGGKQPKKKKAPPFYTDEDSMLSFGIQAKDLVIAAPGIHGSVLGVKKTVMMNLVSFGFNTDAAIVHLWKRKGITVAPMLRMFGETCMSLKRCKPKKYTSTLLLSRIFN